MTYDLLAAEFALREGVEESTMMGSACLRYHGQFMAMWFDKEHSLIIKVSPDRVNELIAGGDGNEFNFTKKRFKEWVLIPEEFEELFPKYLSEALDYAKLKMSNN